MSDGRTGKDGLVADVRQQAVELLEEPVLAAAAFRMGRVEFHRPGGGAGAILAFAWGLWRHRGMGRFPNPAYLVVTATRLCALSFQFGAGATVVRQARQWPRSTLSCRRERDQTSLLIWTLPHRSPVRATPVDPSNPESEAVMRLLT